MTTALATSGSPPPAGHQLPVAMGFGSLQSFEFLQRTAKAFAASTMVPTAYQAMVTKGYGDNQTVEPNPAAMSNCMIALDMAHRMNANPLQVMQNLHVIEGKPSWSSQFIIAAINSSGKFSPLRFDLQWLDEMDATYSTFEWENRRKIEKKHTVRIKNARCIAWAIEKATGERLESAPVTIEMAVNEGWYGKNGSKWRSMPDLMLRYRSAAFFGRIYAPELLMGLPTDDEVRDVFVQDASGAVTHAGAQIVPQSSGKVDPTTGEVRQELPTYPEADFAKGLPGWAKAIANGRKSFQDIVATLETKAPLTAEQKDLLQKAAAAAAPVDAASKDEAGTTPEPTNKDAPAIDWAALQKRLLDAPDLDVLFETADLIGNAPVELQEQLNTAFNSRQTQLEGQP